MLGKTLMFIVVGLTALLVLTCVGDERHPLEIDQRPAAPIVRVEAAQQYTLPLYTVCEIDSRNLPVVEETDT